MYNCRPNIAFLTGGYSSEAAISYKSAINIEKNLDREKFNVYKIDITPQGWFYIPNPGSKTRVNREDFSIEDINGSKITFNAVFIGIHGTPGEDGKLQGYFDMLNVPYTGSGTATSALTMNKHYTVAVASFAGINVAKSLHIFKNAMMTPEEILQQLSLPVFVKPNTGGSSICVSKVTKTEDLDDALKKAFNEDEQVLVEELIAGREFSVGVFRTVKELIVLPITEIKTKNEFFDFEAKYQGLSEEITPAIVDETIAEQLRNVARKVYGIFNCRGVVRIDFIYNEAKNAPFLLEINTIPGQTDVSIVIQQVRAFGWQLKDFYTALVQETLAKKA